MLSRLLAILLAGLCLALSHAPSLAESPVKPQPPNIVLVLADDWGFSDVGSFGGEIATPNLDALAARGARFTNFHVSASCSPTRAMLLTGVDNHLNGVGNMRETIPHQHRGRPGYLTVLNDRVVTVATLLRDAGYRTYVSGKWHVGTEPRNLPPARGFERSIVQGDSGSDNWKTAQRYLDLGDKVQWFEDGREAVMSEDYYSSAYFVDRLIGFMQQDGARRDAPFFAYLPFQANHIPVQAPRAFIDRYAGRYDAGWHALRQQRRERAAALGIVPPDAPMAEMATTRDWLALSPEQRRYEARRMEVYAGMAEAMDHHIGRFMWHLRQQGELDRTVFIFLSDNGAEASDPYAVISGRLWLDWQYRRDLDSLGGPGAYTVIGPSWASAAVSPLMTYKFYSGEGGMRVPLIVAGVPGTVPGAIHPRFTHVNDIAPTLLELAGLPPQQGRYRDRTVEPMRGRSLLPVLRGEADRVHPEEATIGYELSGNQALFQGDYKLLKLIPPVGDGRWRLYDTVRDPGETRDLAEALPQRFAAMQAAYANYAQGHGVLPMPEGYDPILQVQINAFLNVWVPRLRGPAVIVLVLLALLGWRLRHRWRRRSPPAPALNPTSTR